MSDTVQMILLIDSTYARESWRNRNFSFDGKWKISLKDVSSVSLNNCRNSSRRKVLADWVNSMKLKFFPRDTRESSYTRFVSSRDVPWRYSSWVIWTSVIERVPRPSSTIADRWVATDLWIDPRCDIAERSKEFSLKSATTAWTNLTWKRRS